MFDFIPILSKLPKPIYDRFRNVKGALTKEIVKSIVKATIEYKRHSKILHNDVNWDKEKLNVHFNNLQLTDKHFNFYNYDVMTLTENIEPYFPQLDADDSSRIQIITNIITLAQQYFAESAANDTKLINYMIVRGDHPASKIVALFKKMFKEKSNEISTVGFKDLYNEALTYFNKREYKLSLSIIFQAQTSLELDDKEKMVFKFLEISIYYDQYEYKKAYKEVVEIESTIPKRFLYDFLAFKGSILSEKGYENSDVQSIRLAIKTFEQQLTLLETADGDPKNYYYVYYNLGTSFLSLNQLYSEDINIAIDYFESALEIDNTIAELHKNLGTAYGIAHRFEEEVKCYQRALEINPSLFEALCAMGYVKLYYQKDPTSSIKYYEKALRQKHNHQRSYSLFYNSAKAYLDDSKKSKALEVIDVGLKYFPTSDYLIDQKINILVSLQREKPDIYTELLVNYINQQIEPMIGYYAEKIASAYLFAENYEELDEVLNTWPSDIKISVDLTIVYYLYAVKLIEIEKYKKAEYIVSLFEQVNKDPSEDEFLINLNKYLLANLYGDLDQYDKALISYKGIDISILPIEFELYIMIGETLLNLSEYKDARRYFKKAEALQDGQFDVFLGLCKANIGLGKTALAKRALLKMADLSSSLLVNSAYLQKEKKDSDIELTNSRLGEVMLYSQHLAHTRATNQLSDRKGLPPEEYEVLYKRLFKSYSTELQREIIKEISLKTIFFKETIASNIADKFAQAEQQVFGRAISKSIK